MMNAEEQIDKREECEITPKSTSHPESNERKRAEAERDKRLKMKMSKIKHKIAVISGKGGVGKSTVTVNLATTFALQGYSNKVGVLDIHGPCVPKMLGLKGQKLVGGPAGIIFPVADQHGIKVASIDFLLPNDEAPVIWRGPLKMRVIQQFLADIAWGELDFLFIDLPPGTGDEPLSVMQLIPDIDGVVIVTIPSEVSQAVVKKAVTFAKQLGIPIIGIIENMSGFVCPQCGAEIDIFKAGGGKKIAKELSVQYLGKIPIDPSVCIDSDRGTPFVARGQVSTTVQAFAEIVAKIKQFLKDAK
jgi:ATP-binding protein involved in chromosome partitioning